MKIDRIAFDEPTVVAVPLVSHLASEKFVLEIDFVARES